MSSRRSGREGGTTKSHEKNEGHNVVLSRSLSRILRHDALTEGLKVLPGGWVDVDSVLRLKRLSKWTVNDVRNVVASNDKQRFALRESPEDSRILQIRANQGHSFPVDLEAEELSLNHPDTLPSSVIHGTYLKTWKESSIRTNGLSKMARNEIHFSPGIPEEDSEVISGMRKSADVLIYVNLPKALKDGIRFLRSANNVILSPGDHEGYLRPQYFDKVINRKTGEVLFP